MSNHLFLSKNKSLKTSGLFTGKNQRRCLEPSSERPHHSTEGPGVHSDTGQCPPQYPHVLVVWPAHLPLSVLICQRGIMKRTMTECMECSMSLALLDALVVTVSFNSRQNPMKQVPGEHQYTNNNRKVPTL